MSGKERAPLRLGVIGTSSIARRRTLATAAVMPEIDLVAVAGRSPARAEEFAAEFGCAAEADFDTLLKRPDVEAVYLSLPTALHHAWTANALRAGKHVLVEKPIGVDAREARDLCALAQERDLVLRENFMFPHHPQHAVVAELANGGRLGTLSTLSAAFCIPPMPADNIRYSPELGGGALLDVGVYPLRAAMMLLGPGLRVAGATLRRRASDGLDLSGQVLLASSSGVLADLTFGFEHSYASTYSLWGDKARVTVTRAFTPAPTHQPVVLLEEQNREERTTLPASDQLRTLLAAFTTAVRRGGAATAPDEVRARRDAVTAMELVDTVRRQAVDVPFDIPGKPLEERDE